MKTRRKEATKSHRASDIPESARRWIVAMISEDDFFEDWRVSANDEITFAPTETGMRFHVPGSPPVFVTERTIEGWNPLI